MKWQIRNVFTESISYAYGVVLCRAVPTAACTAEMQFAVSMLATACCDTSGVSEELDASMFMFYCQFCHNFNSFVYNECHSSLSIDSL
jgi:hypothetical protein